jgi:hypothetical protein
MLAQRRTAPTELRVSATRQPCKGEIGYGAIGSVDSPAGSLLSAMHAGSARDWADRPRGFPKKTVGPRPTASESKALAWSRSVQG